MAVQRFNTTVQATGKNTTGIVVPAEVIEALDAGKRPKVTATVNGYTYRTTVGSMDGQAMLSVSAAIREEAGLAAGDEVDVAVELDTAPREVEVPDDLAEALRDEPEAAAFFDGLATSYKRAYVDNITGAKKPETRQRRVEATIAKLKDGSIR